MTVFEKWSNFRKEQEEMYNLIVSEFGRFKIGPSGKMGLYINDTENKVNIAGITKEEAEFIINRLKFIYEI